MSVLEKYTIFMSSYKHCDVEHRFLVIVPPMFFLISLCK